MKRKQKPKTNKRLDSQMNAKIKSYLKAEAIVAAAFNFFINGMIAALIYHKADRVTTDTVSIAIDLVTTCFLTFTITALFCRASVRRTKTADILKTGSCIVRFLSRLFNRPVLFGALTGIITAVVLFTLAAPLFALQRLVRRRRYRFELYSGMIAAG